MSFAWDPDPQRLPSTPPRPVEDRDHDDHAGALARLGAETDRAARQGSSGHAGFLLPGLARRRERAELEALRQAARRWSAELTRLREGYEELRDAWTEPAAKGAREERLERALAEREAELRALRGAAAGRELDLQREHDTEARRQREEIDSLKKRLEGADSTSGGARDEELREVKRQAYERERELRRSHAGKLSEIEREAERRVSALREQREADNRSLIQRHATEKSRREEELESLRLRRLSEYRVYGGRIEELARERAAERTSLEEAVAKLREKHEVERARLQERVESLQEALEEQESITVRLLGELGYAHRPVRSQGLPKPAETPGELEPAEQGGSGAKIDESLRELRSIAAPGNLLKEALALFNETEHVKVVEAVSKSLGEPEVYVGLETHGGTEAPAITLVWPGMGWRRYVSEPRAATEPQVYLAARGETGQDPLLGAAPNARLDGRGLLSLGIRPL
jgi:hypothetical protein